MRENSAGVLSYSCGFRSPHGNGHWDIGGDLQTTNVMDVAVVMAMHGNRPRSSRLEGNNLVVWIIAVEYREVEADEDDATCGWRDMIPECLPVTFTIPD